MGRAVFYRSNLFKSRKIAFFLEPEDHGAAPIFHGLLAAEAVAMATVGIVAERAVEARLAGGSREDAGAWNPIPIIRVVDEEHRRKILQRKEFGGNLTVLFKIGGIDGHGEIGTCADLVDVVDRCVGLFIEFAGGANGQMAAGGESHDADAIWIDAPFGGVGADLANGALRILEGALTVVGAAVFKDDGGHAVGGEKFRDFRAFEIPCENAVAAARADDHARGGFCSVLRGIEIQSRFADSRNAENVVGGIACVFGAVGFFAGHFAVRPDFQGGFGAVEGF